MERSFQTLLENEPLIFKRGRLMSTVAIVRADSDCFGRTGIFPIMHMDVVKAEDLAQEKPELIKRFIMVFATPSTPGLSNTLEA